MSGRKWFTLATAVVVVAVAATLLVVLRDSGPAPLPQKEVTAYLRAWERFDLEAMAGLIEKPPPEFADAVTAMKDQLQISKAAFRAGTLTRAPGRSSEVDAAFTAGLDLAGLGQWEYGGQLRLVRRGEAWKVAWSTTALHPALAPGERFERTRRWTPRAPILGRDGAPLVTFGAVTTVGLDSGRIQSQAEIETTFQDVLGVSPQAVREALAQPWVRPGLFVPVIQVRQERFAPLRPRLEPVPGIFFQRAEGRLPPTDGFAEQIIGRVGEVTAERLDELGLPYVVGDVVGLSGFEAGYERELAGTPAGEIKITDAAGTAFRIAHTFPGTPPKPLQLTLDRTIQQAAETALATVTQPAALVAVDTTSGELRAVVSRPLDEQFNRALAGRYPPGSTFKVVTTAALLGAGVRPEETVTCPAQQTVGGQQFVNFEGDVLGSIPFQTAFAKSCNTTFAALSERVTATALSEQASAFGFGATYDLGLPVAGGQFPAPRDAAERAAAALGQGRVLASPLHMASVAAAVASGTWRAPKLVTSAQPGPTRPLDPAAAATLRTLMADVVRDGTGTAVARAGQEIFAKTGTAEFGNQTPPQTHAWFIGYRGTLAFAVLVEGGGVGGRVAAPIAGRFLDAVPR